MKNNLALAGLIGMVMFPVFSFSAGFSGAQAEKKQQQTQRHIRVVKVVDGKKSELDTVVSHSDVFVWKGDSIGGKFGMPFGPFRAQRNARPGRFNGGGPGGPMTRPMGPGGFFVPGGGRPDSLGMTGDTLVHRLFIGRQMRRQMPDRFFLNSQRPDIRHAGPQHRGAFQERDLGNSIDLGDPNIISYSKKNLKGNKEKIEIIRQKTEPKGPRSLNRPAGPRRLQAPMPPAFRGRHMPKLPEMIPGKPETENAQEEKVNETK